MPEHRVPSATLSDELKRIERDGEDIVSMTALDNGEHLVLTEVRLETRPAS